MAAAAVAQPEKDVMKGGLQEQQAIRRIRITLTSGNVKSLEKGELLMLDSLSVSPTLS